MSGDAHQPDLILVVRRTIAAPREALFRAWTDPVEFAEWWGPTGVVCETVEMDLRIGGAYAIANRLPTGAVIWIRGDFEAIEPPNRLAYSWRTEPSTGATSRVVVTFTVVGAATEVVVRHERIATEAVRDEHAAGWAGCLDGLEKHFPA